MSSSLQLSDFAVMVLQMLVEHGSVTCFDLQCTDAQLAAAIQELEQHGLSIGVEQEMLQ